jgi:two-component system NarL family sensor kinase
MSVPRNETDTEKLQRRNRELAILNAIASALNREVDLTRALNAALAQVAELLNLKTGWLWLLREDTGEPYLAAVQNLPPALINDPKRMAGGSCYCLDTFRSGDLNGAANVNVVTCTRLKDLVDDTDGLRYHSSIPLYAHGKKLGVLNVASPDWRELSADDLRLLYTIGDLVSMAIERARLFARSMEYGAVEERNRLAREIHDTLAQGLAAIALQLETADALLEAGADPARARQAIEQSLSLLRANLEEARRSVLDLRAAPLEGRSLAQVLEAMADEATREWNLQTQLDVTGSHRPLPLRVETGLYRIAQEALTNIRRHAEAKHVLIRLIATPDRVELSIEDDGRGFDPTRVPQGRYGLIGLRERVKLLGGELNMDSHSGKGTRLEVSVPLDASR